MRSFSFVLLVLILRIDVIFGDPCKECIECENCEECAKSDAEKEICEHCTFEADQGLQVDCSLFYSRYRHHNFPLGPCNCKISDLVCHQNLNSSVCVTKKTKDTYVSCYDVIFNKFSAVCDCQFLENGFSMAKLALDSLKKVTAKNICPGLTIVNTPEMNNSFARFRNISVSDFSAVKACSKLIIKTWYTSPNVTLPGKIIIQWDGLQMKVRSTINDKVRSKNIRVTLLDKVRVNENSYKQLKLSCDGLNNFNDSCGCFVDSFKEKILADGALHAVLHKAIGCFLTRAFDETLINWEFQCNPDLVLLDQLKTIDEL